MWSQLRSGYLVTGSDSVKIIKISYTLIIGKPPFETPDVKSTYKKIRMNSYSFPENVPISDQARNLITKILNLDPLKRPSLDEILAHQFLNNGGTIPRSLPLSTLACPPSGNYIKQYTNQVNSMRVSLKGETLMSTNSRTNLGVGK
jgi:polo-like kinase 1